MTIITHYFSSSFIFFKMSRNRLLFIHWLSVISIKSKSNFSNKFISGNAFSFVRFGMRSCCSTQTDVSQLQKRLRWLTTLLNLKHWTEKYPLNLRKWGKILSNSVKVYCFSQRNLKSLNSIYPWYFEFTMPS